MKVVLYGATGKAGSVILKELVDRGHTVVAAARAPEKVQKLKNVTAVQDDLSNPAKTAASSRTRTPSSRPMDRRRTILVRSSALRIGSSKASSRPVDTGLS
jgi:NADP-dependent 3-hydroxy acid dehydrogenase YdfG